MKIFANFGKYKIIHGSCLEIFKETIDNSYTTVIADWPFKNYSELLKDVVKESLRVLCNGGTFISVHYPDLNYYVRKECENKGLTFCETINMKTKVSYIIDSNKLPTQNISILTMLKGNLESRKWNFTHSNKSKIFDAESLNIPTDFWGDKQFKNGFKNQLIGKHSEAMPRWVVDKLMKIFVPKDGNVLDLFGGAGTIMLKCAERNIPCISTEINKENCKLMLNRFKIGY